MTNDDSKVDPEAKNFEEVGNTEPKIAPKAMTQNYFSIFNTNSKFKNAPRKVLKKPRVKNVTASKKRKVKFNQERETANMSIRLYSLFDLGAAFIC